MASPSGCRGAASEWGHVAVGLPTEGGKPGVQVTSLRRRGLRIFRGVAWRRRRLFAPSLLLFITQTLCVMSRLRLRSGQKSKAVRTPGLLTASPSGSARRAGASGASSEEADSIPFPRLAKEPRKLHIRQLLPPLTAGPASPGSDGVFFRETVIEERINTRPLDGMHGSCALFLQCSHAYAIF